MEGNLVSYEDHNIMYVCVYIHKLLSVCPLITLALLAIKE